ncbi:hypothetical protein NQ317_019616 [Molorchus minor]|uniref:Uncharacterized protein n=1 Tax=Molorchus minor TaxID=1323400 RepID=A0ABQ9J4I2_9CUCU|nr:hypothetical protein NQ317_019616 [Molorchus minor]
MSKWCLVSIFSCHGWKIHTVEGIGGPTRVNGLNDNNLPTDTISINLCNLLLAGIFNFFVHVKQSFICLLSE